MKVVFVDIDGPFNTHISMNARVLDGVVSVRSPIHQVHKPCVDLLREVVEKTGAKIVVSSTLRFVPGGTTSIGQVQRAFQWTGWRNPPIIGCTPDLARSDRTKKRGDEIEFWIKAVQTRTSDNAMLNDPDLVGQPITHYAIIDDDSDMLPHHFAGGHFIYAGQPDGFERLQADALEAVLTKPQLK